MFPWIVKIWYENFSAKCNIVHLIVDSRKIVQPSFDMKNMCYDSWTMCKYICAEDIWCQSTVGCGWLQSGFLHMSINHFVATKKGDFLGSPGYNYVLFGRWQNSLKIYVHVFANHVILYSSLYVLQLQFLWHRGPHYFSFIKDKYRHQLSNKLIKSN